MPGPIAMLFKNHITSGFPHEPILDSRVFKDRLRFVLLLKIAKYV